MLNRIKEFFRKKDPRGHSWVSSRSFPGMYRCTCGCRALRDPSKLNW